ncbi:MAG: PemK family transcriptional regulator [SAR86 cluster bacterium]|uniref:PemK family transcriptional regulator n=1 Tax=SAR86 cluster bacterium TaxID=2030880 RepID=A0A2A5AUF9_9GAMM|nr:MAG: PemK family transcriptional regulator [SAR86 cluster bacterium]
MYIPDRGDIVFVDFDPSAGKEIAKRRPAIILTRKIFNKHTTLVFAAPITSTIRGIGLEILLPSSMQTNGAILVSQIKSLDYEIRSIDFVEKAPQAVIDEVMKKLNLVLS